MIVLAEDHDDIRYVLKRTLERSGHTVVTAVDGVQALEAIRRHRPDVLVSDVDMPRMNGLDLCRAVRADPRLRHIPVVLVSGSLLPGDARAAEAGASATLLKPFLPAELLACITRLLPSAAAPAPSGSSGVRQA
jgi:CheY-like chemotaxis protein